ncbi:aminotransferase class IV [Eubacterium sp. 1001713B170207_170306_E7]|uniref:aminotransferase class IV n=1 Tax=Eubacterium sp. 1001713B170207_170306_E7 TaxID=2787097 RepID=UPI0018980F75|nr:aminotransferase class IV [Eubacterium sp. 1001713B170207_170306_E7]
MSGQEINMDDGFCFGLGAFETIAVMYGRPVFLEAHLKRIGEALNFLELPNPVTREWVDRILRAHPMKNGVLKIMVSQENCLWSCRKNPYTWMDYERGFVLRTSPVRRNETSPLTYHKTLCYGENILEKRRAAVQGFDEPVFLNTCGQLTEGAVTNLFFVKKGRLVTPDRSCGLLPGTIRDYLISCYDVEERVILPEETGDFDEAFVTNALMGMMPVRQLDGIAYGEKRVWESVLRDYHDLLRQGAC